MSAQLLLIDALNLIRRIYAVDAQQSGNNEQQAVKNTYHRVTNATRKLLKSSKATHAIAVFDGDTSWRYHYYSDYKCSRKPMPSALSESLPYLQQAFTELGVVAYVPQNDEADDIIATLASKASNNGIDSTIVSTDKGFLPLINNHISVFDYFKSEYLTHQYIQDKFSLNSTQLTDFWALNGDKTNDIPGVAGIGKQSAMKLLNAFGSVDNALNTSDVPDELKRIHSKLNDAQADYIRAKLLVSLRLDIHLGFSLKALRLAV